MSRTRRGFPVRLPRCGVFATGDSATVYKILSIRYNSRRITYIKIGKTTINKIGKFLLTTGEKCSGIGEGSLLVFFGVVCIAFCLQDEQDASVLTVDGLMRTCWMTITSK